MAKFLGYGTGKDGAPPTSGALGANNYLCAGSASSYTLTCEGIWAPDDYILIMQTTGTGVSAWETNKIISDNGGNLTLANPLDNTYTDSGASRAQALELKEFTGGEISGTLTPPAEFDPRDDPTDGGILAFMVNGTLTVSGSLNVQGFGLIAGATAQTGGEETGQQGWGYLGTTPTKTRTTNSSGGGGGGSNYDNPGGGGGGGNQSIGAGGDSGSGGGGAGGNTSNAIITGTTLSFGGAGGNGGTGHIPCQGGVGGDGGGLLIVFARNIIVTGSINCRGANGGSGAVGRGGGGGGGAGGFGLLYAHTIDYSSGQLLAVGGAGGNPAPFCTAYGGAGGNGFITMNTCNVISGGTTNGAITTYAGGHNWCMLRKSIL